MTKSLLKRGFTLVELLIVIVVIGILAVAVVPRFTRGPALARDGVKKNDLSTIATAIDLSFAENPTKYPTSTGCVTADLGSLTAYFPASKIPTDPNTSTTNNSGACTNGYGYKTGTTNPTDGYILTAAMEGNPSVTDQGMTCWNKIKGETTSAAVSGYLTAGGTSEGACTEPASTFPIFVIAR